MSNPSRSERLIESSIDGEGQPMQPSRELREAAAASLKDGDLEDAADKV